MGKNERSLEDDVLASLASSRKEDIFEKKPEDADFSQFLPTEADIREMNEITTPASPGEVITYQEAQVPSLSSTVINPAVERDTDYDYARKNLKEIIETSKKSLDELKTVAIATNHPRAYEVVAILVDTIVDANKKLMELHKQRQELEIKEKELNKPVEAQNVTNNNLFVGSSTQLLEFVKNLHKVKDDVPTE